MAQQNNWEADKMLDVYIYDYLLKRNLQTTAKAFMAEGKVAADPVAIDAPGGFLFEWWSVFWDIFIARTNDKHSEVAAAYLEAQQMKAREHQQQLQMQQLQLIQQRQAQLQRSNSAHLNGPMNNLNSDGLLGPSTASVLAAKMYEERLKNPSVMDSDAMDATRMALLKSAATNHAGQLVQGNPGSMSTTLQQMQQRNQQAMEIKSEANLSVAQRSLPMDPSSIYGQSIIQSKTGLTGPGLNQGVSGLPLKGWPLTGIDQLRPNMNPQMQKPFLSTHSQFQLMSPQQQQQLIAQAHAAQQGNNNSNNNNIIMGNNSVSFGDLDHARRFGLGRGSGSGPVKDPQVVQPEGSIGSPTKVRQEQAEYLMKLKVAQMQQQSSSSQQNPELQQQQQQQQLQQNNNNRKRKQPTSSGAANSTGTGNTVGPTASSPPSTPSTHTGTGNLHLSKSLMMYGTDGTGLGASSTQMDDLEHFGDVASLDDNVESFLSNDDGDPRDIFATLKTEHNPTAKGFTFSEASVFPTSNKLICCHFSSDGKYLASAGHEKKAIIWNMDTLQTQSTPEDHNVIITDVRFRPNSTQFATSSFDRTVKLWNAAEPGFCLHTFTGHTSHVTSLDFHPKKTDILCSCDGNGEIRFWSVNQFSCNHVSKGGTAQVRFQPNIGQLLAAATENIVSIFDVESDRKKYTLQGHMSDVQSLCWDNSGEYLASVSKDSVKVWSIANGDCIHELSSNENQFHSCVFHPTYANLLVIGGYKNLELWNMAKNQKMTVQSAHDCLIASLAQSPATGMVASASHDNSVKLWK